MADWRARREALRGAERRVVAVACFSRIRFDAFDTTNERKKSRKFVEVCLTHLKNHLQERPSVRSDEELEKIKTLEQAHDCGELVLRGREKRIFNLLGPALTTDEWARLLGFPLEMAATTGAKELAAQLIEAGAAIGIALHAAAHGGHKAMVKFLLENGASLGDLDCRGETPLHVAARAGQLAITRSLLRRGADHSAMGSGGGTPLFWSARHGHVAVSEALLAAGADLTLRYKEHRYYGHLHGHLSPLDAAVLSGHMDTVRALIARGADVKAADSEGRTALCHANSAKAVDLLVEAGANMDARICAGTFAGSAPLHLALHRSKHGAAVALLKNGADVNARTDKGETPLHYAAGPFHFQGMARTVDLLLRMGADETVANDEGLTPADAVVRHIQGRQNIYYAHHSHAHELGLVRLLLVNAAVDRAWRRRGFLVMCRAHRDRVRPKRSSGIAWRTRRRARKTKAAVSASGRLGDSAVDEGDTCEGSNVAASVVELDEEGLFRKIVAYL